MASLSSCLSSSLTLSSIVSAPPKFSKLSSSLRISAQAVEKDNDNRRVGSSSRREVVVAGGLLGAMVAVSAPESRAAFPPPCLELTSTPSGLAFCDTAVGSGIPASKGLLIKAHYSGKLESGQVFDSSYNRGKPLVFRIGVGEVIRGWDQGILGGDGMPAMLAGGKRTLKIPPQLAYGERGAGCRGGSCLIPPNSVLIFDVEFVGKA